MGNEDSPRGDKEVKTLTLLYTGTALLSVGAMGILFAVAMEIATAEPAYYLVMRVTAGLFGVGGILFGLAEVRRKKICDTL